MAAAIRTFLINFGSDMEVVVRQKPCLISIMYNIN